MPQEWQFPVLVLAVVFFLGWFFLGNQWNVRKGDQVLKWLRLGLPLIGERTTLRWLGSSVVELKIAKAKDPFRSAETLVAFEPRDVVFFWALARLQGRRDTLIFRSQLRSAPSFEMEAFDPKGWTTRTSERVLESKDWSKVQLADAASLVAYCSNGASANAAKPLVDAAAKAGGRLMRLSVRRSVPNLEVHWLLPDLENRSARDFFLKLKQIGEDVLNA